MYQQTRTATYSTSTPFFWEYGMSICESAPIACNCTQSNLQTIVYNVPVFSVHFDACADSVYQAVFFLLLSKWPGDEPNCKLASYEPAQSMCTIVCIACD